MLIRLRLAPIEWMLSAAVLLQFHYHASLGLQALAAPLSRAKSHCLVSTTMLLTKRSDDGAHRMGFTQSLNMNQKKDFSNADADADASPLQAMPDEVISRSCLDSINTSEQNPQGTVDVTSNADGAIYANAAFSITAAMEQAKHSNSLNPHELSPQQFVYVALTSLFITCLLIADVVGVKLFSIPLPFPIFGFTTVEHTCGMITFPVTFLLGDIINEYFGANAAKSTVYLGFAMSVFVFLIMNISQGLPYLDAPFNVTKESFDMIFGSAKLMYVASLTAYLLGSLADIWLFGIIKRLTKGKLLWLRATGSTVLSQVLDSFVVSYIAFSLGKTLTGQTAATLPEVLNIAATGYGLKFSLAAAMTPLLYLFKEVLTNRMGIQPIPVEQYLQGTEA